MAFTHVGSQKPELHPVLTTDRYAPRKPAPGVYRLAEPASVQYKQVAVFGSRCKRHQYLRDFALLDSVRGLEMLASKAGPTALSDGPTAQYQVPPSGPVVLTNTGIPLDEVEDLLLDSAALGFDCSHLRRSGNSPIGQTGFDQN